MTTFAETDLNQCISCGLCLGSCPTYRVTGLETSSPRGRIEAMRAVADGTVALDDPTFGTVMEECVQCHACEAVCPSLAPFGKLMEQARAARHDLPPPPSVSIFDPTGVKYRHRTRGLLESVVFRFALPRGWVLRLATVGLAVLQLLRLDRALPVRLRVPARVRLREALRPLRTSPTDGTEVALFRGCVMDHWLRPVHQDTIDVLAAAGLTATWPNGGGLCCGALHVHQGRREEAKRLAADVIAAFPGEARIVVDSAGCGAALKEYGHLLGTDEAATFAARVVDFSEVAELRELAPSTQPRDVVGYQHVCHLRNVQRITAQPLALLTDIAGCEVREGDEPGVCCGAGGAYSVLQPALATDIRDRKAASLRGPDTIVTTNPGCQLHLAGAGLPMEHLATYLARRLGVGRFARK